MRYTIILLSGLFIAHACSKKQDTESETTIEVKTGGNQVTLSPLQIKNAGVQVVRLSNQELSNKILLSGQIDVPPNSMASVSSQTDGIIKSANFMPGNYVKRGQTLALVENPELVQLQQEYLTAKSNLSYAQKNAQRQNYLNQYQAVSAKQAQQAQTEARNQNIAVSSLAARLSSLGIRPGSVSSGNIRRTVAVNSPISGYISKVNTNVGQYVAPSEILFEVVNTSKRHLVLKVFEKDLPKIALGQRVFAFTNENRDKKYEARIALIGKDFGPDRSVQIQCHFIEESAALIPGLYMNAEIETDAQEAYIIPDDAIVTWEGRQYIFEELKPGTYKMFPVNIGNSENGYTQLSSMTHEGASKRFVTKGAYQLLMALKNVEE